MVDVGKRSVHTAPFHVGCSVRTLRPYLDIGEPLLLHIISLSKEHRGGLDTEELATRLGVVRVVRRTDWLAFSCKV